MRSEVGNLGFEPKNIFPVFGFSHWTRKQCFFVVVRKKKVHASYRKGDNYMWFR